MTLSELASFITTKVSQIESNDIAACKTFLQRRFQMIWQDQLWKDSLFEYTQAVTSTGYDTSKTWLPTKQILLVAPAITQVVAVRNSEWKLNVESSELFYRQDWDAFQNQGRACEYRLLAPVVWETEEPIDFTLGLEDGGSEVNALITFLNEDQQTPRSDSFAVGSESVSGPTTERVDSCNLSGDCVTSVVLAVPVAGTTPIVVIESPAVIAAKRQRVQIIGSMSDTTLRVLGKVQAPIFENDADSPLLTGVDNCLIAFAQADMLFRERQHAKALQSQQEGQMLLEQLKREQVVQQAHYKRFVPENGYGWEFQPIQGGFVNSFPW